MSRRREFSTVTKRTALARSNGVCEAHLVPFLPVPNCAAALTAGNVFFEHIQCDALDGANDLDNCACLCRTHWKMKTARYDLPSIAKSKRQRDRNAGIRPNNYPPLIGTKRSGWKRSMNGSWSRRTI